MSRGGCTEKKEEKEERFPLCVRVQVIGPFEAAAQKETDRPTNRPTNRPTKRMKILVHATKKRKKNIGAHLNNQPSVLFIPVD